MSLTRNRCHVFFLPPSSTYSYLTSHYKNSKNKQQQNPTKNPTTTNKQKSKQNKTNKQTTKKQKPKNKQTNKQKQTTLNRFIRFVGNIGEIG